MPVRITRLCALILIPVFAAGLSLSARAAATAKAERGLDRKEIRSWFQERARFWGFTKDPTPTDLGRMTELKLKAESPDPATPVEDRQNAYRELAALVFSYLGGDPDASFNTGMLTRWANAAGTAADTWAKSGKPYPQPEEFEPTPPGKIGRVHKQGRGPVPMLLLVSLQHNWTQYKTFMELNEERYTMYTVTLPGFDSTPPPPLPPVRDFSKLAWWNNAAEAVMSFIEEENLQKPVVVGTMASGYLAGRLVLDHPDSFRAAVLLHALVNSPAFSLPPTAGPDGFQRASMAERIAQANQTLPVDLGLPVSRMTPKQVEANLENPTPGIAFSYNYLVPDLERGQEIYRIMNLTSHPNNLTRYLNELRTTDLTEPLRGLSVPTLIVPAINDLSLAGPGGTYPAIQQWQEIKLLYPSIPLTIVPFWSTWAMPSEHRPEELSQAIADFLAGKPVRHPTERQTPSAVSPMAGVSQVLGQTRITVEYFRPGVKGRQIWGSGNLVPYGVLWRTGANSATRISFDSDLQVEGQTLPAGEYSLHTVPGESEWTVIFNKIAYQTGAYDKRFDALRLTVKPQTVTENQEWFRISFEDLNPNNAPPTSASLVLRWEKLAVPIRIEVASQ